MFALLPRPKAFFELHLEELLDDGLSIAEHRSFDMAAQEITQVGEHVANCEPYHELPRGRGGGHSMG